MTTRSRRRTAELAVIEAANRVLDAEFYWPALPTGYRELTDLEEAVRALRAIELEVPDAVRTGNDNPCFTSTEAADWMRKSGKAQTVAARAFTAIYRAYRGNGTGLTTDQLEHHLGGSHQSISPRITELRDKGFIKDSGIWRKTRQGNKAVVWTPTQTAIDAASQGGMPWNWTASLSSTTDGS